MTCNACGKEHWVQVDYCYKSSVEIERDYLKSENSRLRKALEFYADAKSIRSSDPYCVVWEGWRYSGYDKRPIEIGTKAREALKGGQ
jgi:hypothetical protein